jgi:hypothetical protein
MVRARMRRTGLALLLTGLVMAPAAQAHVLSIPYARGAVAKVAKAHAAKFAASGAAAGWAVGDCARISDHIVDCPYDAWMRTTVPGVPGFAEFRCTRTVRVAITGRSYVREVSYPAPLRCRSILG